MLFGSEGGAYVFIVVSRPRNLNRRLCGMREICRRGAVYGLLQRRGVVVVLRVLLIEL